MNIKGLSVASMVMVTSRWLSGEPRKVIDGLPLCRALLVKLEEVHEALLTAYPQRSALEVVVKEARAMTSGVDQTFDGLGRGLFRALQALEALAALASSAQAARYAAARLALFPKGLSVLMMTYLQEVGEARLAKERLTSAQRALLDAASIGDQTLGSVFDGWIAAADSLNAALIDRDAAEAALANADDAVTLGDIYQARLAWVRVVNAFLTNLDLEPISPEARADLLKTLEEEASRITT
jgi:hypothetical protein